MSKQYTIEIDDLNDRGLLIYLSAALQTEIKDFGDWSVFGPLIERFRIGLSYLANASTKRLTLSGDSFDEPWSAEMTSTNGDHYLWGSSPSRAIAKVIIDSSMKGEVLSVPQREAEKLLVDPQAVEQENL